jgi:chemotaxis family two-component system sensor kinase Cph1
MRTLIAIVLVSILYPHSNALAESNVSLSEPITLCKAGTCDTTRITQKASVSFGEQFSSFFSSITDTSQWPARWNCGVWSPLHGWIYILSDFFIWLSYFAIPVILAYFVYKKQVENIPFKTVLVLFIVFILACGFTHLMDAAIFWWPAYKLSAVLRLGTAIVSMVTVVSLIKVIPGVLELKSPAYLEQQVNERTKDLSQLNDQLHAEMAERKKASDHLKASNQELMAFSYSVSHDLRAPLRSIHGFSQALLEDYSSKLDNEGMDFLLRICNASSRMGELIDDMLKLSKISRDEITLEEVNLSAIVHEVISSLIQRNPTIKASFEIEEGIITKGDHKLLKIALENLISNAIKYSSKNNFSKVQFGKQKDQNVFFIKDNGVGFDMLFADKLFRAFQRLHEGEFDGSGIGLATVKRIIAKHGGSIWAEAKVDEGATFYFTI